MPGPVGGGTGVHLALGIEDDHADRVVVAALAEVGGLLGVIFQGRVWGVGAAVLPGVRAHILYKEIGNCSRFANIPGTKYSF